jgi:hypothetical protein
MAYDKPFEVRPNTGSLFAKDIKKTPESPDYMGTLKIDVRSLNVVNGIADVTLFGRKKETKNGSMFLSLSIANKMDQQQPRRQEQRDEQDPF